MKYFNTEGSCIPEENYMVDLTSRAERIEQEIVARGKYFTVNRARQYGKTTFLYLLKRRLQEKYIVLSFSFESSEMKLVSFDVSATFSLDMSYSAQEIAGMLREYEADHKRQRELLYRGPHQRYEADGRDRGLPRGAAYYRTEDISRR